MALVFIQNSIGILVELFFDKTSTAEIDEYQRKCHLRCLFHVGRNFVRELEFRFKFLQRFCSHILLLFTKKKLKFFNKDKLSSELFNKSYYKKQMAVELFKRLCSHLHLLFTNKKLKIFRKDKTSSDLFHKFYQKKQMAAELFKRFCSYLLLIITKKKLKVFNQDKSSSEFSNIFYKNKQMAAELFRNYIEEFLFQNQMNSQVC